MTRNEIRTANFLRILREKYRDSPAEFEAATGYPAGMVSHFKSGNKEIGEKLAAKLEKLMKCPAGTLEQALTHDLPDNPPSPAAATDWPLSVPLADFQALNPRLQHEIDEAFTRMVLGAQAQDLLLKQSKIKRG